MTIELHLIYILNNSELSKKNLNVQNVISKLTFGVLSNAELIFLFSALGKPNILIYGKIFEVIDLKVEKYYISCNNLEIIMRH